MKKRVLFVCVENSCRSQLAEAFGQIHKGENIEVYSAGSNPSGQVNPKAVAVMSERDYDLRAHASKSFDDIPKVEFDGVITMGCGDNCTDIRGRLREDWGFPDPKLLPVEEFRQVRDQIEMQVIDLFQRLSKG